MLNNAISRISQKKSSFLLKGKNKYGLMQKPYDPYDDGDVDNVLVSQEFLTKVGSPLIPTSSVYHPQPFFVSQYSIFFRFSRLLRVSPFFHCLLPKVGNFMDVNKGDNSVSNNSTKEVSAKNLKQIPDSNSATNILNLKFICFLPNGKLMAFPSL